MFRRTVLGLAAAPWLRAASGEEWIERLGGTVEHDASGQVVAARLAGTWVNDSELLELLAYPKLRKLDLSHTRIGDEGLLHLRPARGIEDLNLFYAEQITDQGLNAIKQWRGLKRLDVRGTRVADGALAVAGQLPALESLDVANTAITDSGLDNLVSLTRLKHLAIGRSRLGDSAAASIRFLNTLESLDLSGPRAANRNQNAAAGNMADVLVRAIAELAGLRVLKLGHSNIDGTGLATLAPALGKLEQLGLEGCSKVDDEALRTIAKWSSVRRLDVQDTKTSREGLAWFRAARPEVRLLENGASS